MESITISKQNPIIEVFENSDLFRYIRDFTAGTILNDMIYK